MQVYIRFAGLRAEVFCGDGVPLAILYKMGAALTKLKADAGVFALAAHIQHPVIIEGPCVFIGFAAQYHQLNAVKIGSNVHGAYKGLKYNVFMFYGKAGIQERPVF